MALHSVSLMLSCRKFILFGIYGCKLWCIKCLNMLGFWFYSANFTAKKVLLQPPSRFLINIPYYDNFILFGYGIFTLPVKYHICQKHTSYYFRAIMLSDTIAFDEKPLCRWRWRPISKLFDIGTIRSAMNDNDLVWLVLPNWIALNKHFTNR